jgi:putative endonuclease
MNNFHYVYVLQSLSHPQQIYTGLTADLKKRLAEHNAGRAPHTSKFAPWEIRAAIAFKSKERAVAFERNLKNGSGLAFLHRHFQPRVRQWFRTAGLATFCESVSNCACTLTTRHNLQSLR